MDLFEFLAPFYDWLGGRKNTERLVRQIEAQLRPSPQERLLDLGGGTGRVSAGLRRQVQEVVVLDTSRGMLVQARRKGGLSPLRGHAAAIPLSDGSVDTVLCIDAFHHFRHQGKVLEEVRRVLRPSGRVFLHDYDPEKISVKLMAVQEWLMGNRNRFYHPEELREGLEAQGLRMVWESRDGVTYSLLLERGHSRP